ncbi:MAG: hypothetical protein WC655_04215 [Candidatus Hydrogenedentales bacterium]|jgi:hypothetical protein
MSKLRRSTAKYVLAVLLGVIAMFLLDLAPTLKFQSRLTHWKSFIGFETVENAALLMPMFSPNHVEEVLEDENKDGKIDNWFIHIRRDRPLDLCHHLTDTNGDSVPDVLGESFSGDLTVMVLADYDLDGVPDRLRTRFQPSVEEPIRIYEDSDLDGNWDLMLLKMDEHTKQWFLVYNTFVLPVIAVEKRRPEAPLTAWIQNTDESRLRVELGEGSWVLCTDQRWQEDRTGWPEPETNAGGGKAETELGLREAAPAKGTALP